ncbi:hypothetical protein C8R43DRAFT_1208966 [Mycena crocata]|nr:hypothetical protein C8R43DRAFT_1208966 [Mycena crocata]
MWIWVVLLQVHFFLQAGICRTQLQRARDPDCQIYLIPGRKFDTELASSSNLKHGRFAAKARSIHNPPTRPASDPRYTAQTLLQDRVSPRRISFIRTQEAIMLETPVLIPHGPGWSSASQQEIGRGVRILLRMQPSSGADLSASTPHRTNLIKAVLNSIGSTSLKFVRYQRSVYSCIGLTCPARHRWDRGAHGGDQFPRTAADSILARIRCSGREAHAQPCFRVLRDMSDTAATRPNSRRRQESNPNCNLYILPFNHPIATYKLRNTKERRGTPIRKRTSRERNATNILIRVTPTLQLTRRKVASARPTIVIVLVNCSK